MNDKLKESIQMARDIMYFDVMLPLPLIVWEEDESETANEERHSTG